MVRRKDMLIESQRLLDQARLGGNTPSHDCVIDAVELLVDVAKRDRWYLRLITFAAVALVLILYFSDLFASFIAKFFVRLFG